MKKHTVTINGLSKSHSMTGWRIGYAAGPEEIIKAASNLQSHATSNPTSFCQAASITALKGSSEELNMMFCEFNKRRNYITDRLNSMKGIKCYKPAGAFYVFPNVSGLIGRSFRGKVIKDSFTLVTVLLENARIATVPGSAFGKENFLRLSYATSLDNIIKGLDRLEEFVDNLG